MWLVRQTVEHEHQGPAQVEAGRTVRGTRVSDCRQPTPINHIAYTCARPDVLMRPRVLARGWLPSLRVDAWPLFIV